MPPCPFNQQHVWSTRSGAPCTNTWCPKLGTLSSLSQPQLSVRYADKYVIILGGQSIALTKNKHNLQWSLECYWHLHEKIHSRKNALCRHVAQLSPALTCDERRNNAGIRAKWTLKTAQEHVTAPVTNTGIRVCKSGEPPDLI